MDIRKTRRGLLSPARARGLQYDDGEVTDLKGIFDKVEANYRRSGKV